MQSKGLSIRGTKEEILQRLKGNDVEAADSAGASKSSGNESEDEVKDESGHESEDGTFTAGSRMDDEGSMTSDDASPVALTAEALADFECHVITGDRRLVSAPQWYSPSNSPVDDDDSDARGISVDSGMDVYELSSDSSRAKSICAAQKSWRL